MSATILPSIQREMIRYGATVYLVFGLVGNICSCIMFTRRAYRHTASSTYLLSLTVFSAMYLIWSFSPLLYSLNYPDLQTTSLFYCKIRQYGGHVIALQMRYAIVFAAIDRFLITRANVRIRSLSSVKAARIIVCVTPILFLGIAAHMPALTIIRNGACVMPGSYRLIYAIYQNIILSLAPPILMSIFSLLTMHSLRQRRNATQVHSRQRDRHLARMVVAEVIINVLTSIPFSANLLYGAATYYVTNKSAARTEIESFCNFVSLYCIYFLGLAPFYLFMSVSKPFRNEFACLVVDAWYKYIRRRPRIAPLSFGVSVAANNDRTIPDKQ